MPGLAPSLGPRLPRYRAFDEENGIEVAWNKVKLRNVEEKASEQLLTEVKTLGKLDHGNIIHFYGSWSLAKEDSADVCINFITERCYNTLRECVAAVGGGCGALEAWAAAAPCLCCPSSPPGDCAPDARRVCVPPLCARYFTAHRKVKVEAIKHWSRQILAGLDYMHNLSPPVIHRDIKLENIFINGNSGEIKIGDLGLAKTVDGTAPSERTATCVGTPEYMAPELYDGAYDTKVDIWSFGLCVLELLTHEFPYEECKKHCPYLQEGARGPAACGAGQAGGQGHPGLCGGLHPAGPGHTADRQAAAEAPLPAEGRLQRLPPPAVHLRHLTAPRPSPGADRRSGGAGRGEPAPDKQQRRAGQLRSRRHRRHSHLSTPGERRATPPGARRAHAGHAAGHAAGGSAGCGGGCRRVWRRRRQACQPAWRRRLGATPG